MSLAASAAEAYKAAAQQGQEQLAPKLRESKLRSAITKWNQLLAAGECPSSLNKNLAKANGLLADLAITNEQGGSEFCLQPTLRGYHARESVEAFTASFSAGESEGRESEWLDEVLARAQDAFTGWMAITRSQEGNLDEILRMRSAALRLPTPLQAGAMLEVVDAIYHRGISLLDAGTLSEAHKAFREVERPLAEADVLCRRSGVRSDYARLNELRDSVVMHTQIAESRLAINIGDGIVNRALSHSEALDMEALWMGIDKYQEAQVLTRGCDIETEAIALAKRGRVYAKVLRNENLARPLLVQATTLAASLAPRSFYGVAWYDECVRQLKVYQDATADADARAEARRRQAELRQQEPIRRKLKAELAALEKYALDNNAYQLLKHVYDKYEPRLALYENNAAAVKKRVADANADTLKRVLRDALVHYHPDKNGEHGPEWSVRCEEVFKHLNGKYDRVKQG